MGKIWGRFCVDQKILIKNAGNKMTVHNRELQIGVGCIECTASRHNEQCFVMETKKETSVKADQNRKDTQDP